MGADSTPPPFWDPKALLPNEPWHIPSSGDEVPPTTLTPHNKHRGAKSDKQERSGNKIRTRKGRNSRSDQVTLSGIRQPFRMDQNANGPFHGPWTHPADQPKSPFIVPQYPHCYMPSVSSSSRSVPAFTQFPNSVFSHKVPPPFFIPPFDTCPTGKPPSPVSHRILHKTHDVVGRKMGKLKAKCELMEKHERLKMRNLYAELEEEEEDARSRSQDRLGCTTTTDRDNPCLATGEDSAKERETVRSQLADSLRSVKNVIKMKFHSHHPVGRKRYIHP